jgi:hypothetical protein
MSNYHHLNALRNLLAQERILKYQQCCDKYAGTKQNYMDMYYAVCEKENLVLDRNMRTKLREMTPEQFDKYYKEKDTTIDVEYKKFADKQTDNPDECEYNFSLTKHCPECKENVWFSCRQCWWNKYRECRRSKCTSKREPYTCFCVECNYDNGYERDEYLKKFGHYRDDDCETEDDEE